MPLYDKIHRIGVFSIISFAAYGFTGIGYMWYMLRSQHNSLKEQQERMNIRSEAYERKSLMRNTKGDEEELEEEEQ